LTRAFLSTLAATAFALALSGGLYAAFAQQADAPANPFAGDAAAIPAGMAIYNVTCAACHGAGGNGGSGPALNTGHFNHGDSDGEIFQTIRNGIDGTEMPSFDSLSTENNWRLVTYIKSLVTPAPTPPRKTDTGNAAAGESLFFGKGGCTACHEISGRGMDLAADLSAEGTRSAQAIRDGIAHRGAAARTADVTLASGKKVNGVIRAEDSFTLHLEQHDGTLLMLDKKSVHGISAPVPLAGPQIAAGLPGPDIDNLVAFLAVQTARNLAETARRAPVPVLPYARIAAPDARDWASPRGTLDGSFFSALNQVTPANAERLQARWTASLGEGAAASTPIAVDGVLYVSGAAGDVTAFDGRSGLRLWRFTRQPVIANAIPAGANRGVAVLDGRVFVGTSDNKLIALDAHNGRVLWEKQTASTLDGYAMTGAPLALHTRVIVGVAGTGPKARGWLDAYDPETGVRLWRFESVAAAQAAGAMTASVGAYEAANVTLYWSTGRTTDGGAYGDSVLALNANSGAVTWRHALKPGAGGGSVAMADIMVSGKRRAMVLYVGQDGLFSLLDRADGRAVLEKSLTDDVAGGASFSFDRSSAVLHAGIGETVLAVDGRTGRTLWRTRLGSAVGGVLATRGGVVMATTAEGNFLALDGRTGKVLWRFKTPGGIGAAPMSYAVDSRQYVAVTAQGMVYAFALPE
jgi:alcohol dehydrogenase (cytochrome c)